VTDINTTTLNKTVDICVLFPYSRPIHNMNAASWHLQSTWDLRRMFLLTGCWSCGGTVFMSIAYSISQLARCCVANDHWKSSF